METVRVLQIGTKNWRDIYSIPKYANWHYVDGQERMDEGMGAFDIVFIDGAVLRSNLSILYRIIKAHTLFLTSVSYADETLAPLVQRKCGKVLPDSSIGAFLSGELRNFYPSSFGRKVSNDKISVNRGFKGEVYWDGNYCVSLKGNYGEYFSQPLFWTENMSIPAGEGVEFWLEYKKEDTAEVELQILLFSAEESSDCLREYVFTEKQMEEPCVVEGLSEDTKAFAALRVKGSGCLQVMALHYRLSRRGYGTFLPGGERLVTSDREEVFCYFDPGDLKPPLNVYFAGYKTDQGFEGYKMMRELGAPFLLISEARLEGGAFYIGSDEYESLIMDRIQTCLDKLGFSEDDLVMSGLSMGTHGAMYYGAQLRPHGLVLGKPLASLGDMAYLERFHRPGGFATSLDILHHLEGAMDEDAIDKLNEHFWNVFDRAVWEDTKMVITYLWEDDYDPGAYQKLMEHLNGQGIQLYGKGIPGTGHSDSEKNKSVQWFMDQYKKLLATDYPGR